jgi:FkbM family methyltransferase
MPMSVENLFHVVDTRYGRMTVFANDIGAVTQSLQTYGEWAENELSFLGALIPQGSTVVDVGAYVGTHTLAFAHFVGSEGRVISIEPQQESFALLKNNVVTNGLTNVQLEHGAAADHTGSLKISVMQISRRESFGSVALCRSDMPPEHRSIERDLQSEPIKSVKALTIDSLKIGSCALIKIDVEGFEDLVISGAKHTIRQLSPAIYAECNSVANATKTFEIMCKLGYEVRMHVVDAFNQDNFLRVARNIFGSARETALIGVKGAQLTLVDNMHPRHCELVLKIESVDDLALGMLNKPQYVGEVLQAGAAARSGGDVWIKEVSSLRDERDEARQIAHEALQEAKQGCDEARQIAHEALQEAKQAREQAEASNAHAEAAMRQARFAREEADQAQSNLVRAQADGAQLNQTLTAVLKSRSWRVTKPLRSLKRLLHKSS